MRALLLTLLLSSSAHAGVDVAWDCYLASGPVACPKLESALFSNKAFGRVAGAKSLLRVRAIGVSNGTRYKIELMSPDATFTYEDGVPQEFSSDAVLIRLVGDIEKVSAPLFAIDEPGTMGDDGVLHLALRDPSLGPRKARSDNGTTGWYAAPSLRFYGDQYGVLELQGHGDLEINYSNPGWRLHGWSWSGYRYVHTDDTNFAPKDRTYENVDGGTSWVAAHSILGGFSLSAQAEVGSEPQNNRLFRANTYVGAEWVLVPFLKTDEGNLGIQYVVGAEHENYVYETVLNRKEFDWLRHRCSVFATWHFDKVDLDGRGTFESMVNDLHFSAFSGSASATWRLLDDLSVSVGGDASFRNGLVNEPKDLSQLPPLAAFYGGGSYGDITWDMNASLQYVFGNSLILRQDQRWK